MNINICSTNSILNRKSPQKKNKTRTKRKLDKNRLSKHKTDNK